MKILIIIISIFCSTALYGQNIKRPDSYNYTRGVEAIRNENTKEALEYLNKEIEEHPDNGYAYSWIALVRNYNEEYGGALLAADRAVKLIPKKDKEYWIFAYLTRANVFKGLEKDDYALQDYNQVLKEYPDYSDALENRAQLYYEQKRYDLANRDYKKLISIERGNTMGYMGLGRNDNAQKKFQDAIKQFDYVIKLAPDYSSGYSFRAESYIGLKKWYQAIDDIITALSIDNDNKAFYLMQTVAESAYSILVSKLKIQKLKSPNNNSWPYYLGVINEYTENYDKAAVFYKEALDKEASPITAYRLSNCLDETGDYNNAIEYCKQAIKLDSTDYDYPLMLANVLDNAGKSEEGIKVLDKLIEKYPDFGFAYHRRGWMKDHTGDIDGAIEDYSMSITIIPDHAYTYLNRGRLWDLKGEFSEAKKDYEQVVKLDSIPENAECSFFAYYHLGKRDKALEILNKVLKDENKGNCYEAACLYSIMGEKDNALKYLEKSLKLGYNRFSHIRRDRDFNNIRHTEQFEQLVSQYEKAHMRLDLEEKETYSFINKTVEIPFTKENGIYKVKCEINKLPLYFVFDTGATDISISSVEATFMLKNDYLRNTDIIGKQNYLTADGSICEGTVLNLQSVDFGGMKLSNIRASVVHNQKAPLLLGQSVLNKLGTIEIDNSKCVLKITYTEKVKQ